MCISMNPKCEFHIMLSRITIKVYDTNMKMMRESKTLCNLIRKHQCPISTGTFISTSGVSNHIIDLQIDRFFLSKSYYVLICVHPFWKFPLSLSLSLFLYLSHHSLTRTHTLFLFIPSLFNAPFRINLTSYHQKHLPWAPTTKANTNRGSIQCIAMRVVPGSVFHELLFPFLCSFLLRYLNCSFENNFPSQARVDGYQLYSGYLDCPIAEKLTMFRKF